MVVLTLLVDVEDDTDDNVAAEVVVVDVEGEVDMSPKMDGRFHAVIRSHFHDE